MDVRLRIGDVKMVLKKQHALSSHGIFEMLRSKEVYQVQNELSKQMDSTIKHLSNEAQLKEASFRAEKMTFLKKVQRRNEKTRLVNKILFKLYEHYEENHQDCLYAYKPNRMALPVVTVPSNPPSESHASAKARPISGKKHKLKDVMRYLNIQESNEPDESVRGWIVVPGPNTQWMNEITSRNLERRRLLSSARRVRSSRGRGGRVEPDIRTTGPIKNQTTTQTIPDKTDQLPQLSVSEPVPLKSSDGHRALGSYNNYHKGMLPPLITIEKTITRQTSSHVVKQGEKYTAVNQLAVNTANLRPTEDPLKISKIQNSVDSRVTLKKHKTPTISLGYPVRNYRGAQSKRFDHKQSSPSKITPALKTQRRRKSGRKRKTSQSKFQNPNDALKRENTVSMIFVEGDNASDLDSRRISLFDIDALLAYRKLTRGHSEIVFHESVLPGSDSEVERQSDNNEAGNEESCQKKKDLLVNRSLQTDRPKTSRERSMEWYSKFLESKRKLYNDNKEKGYIVGNCTRNSEEHFLPPIVPGREQRKVDFLRKDSKKLSSRVTPEKERQRLQEHTKFLQIKVSKFVKDFTL